MTFRLLVIDIDGTLVDSASHVTSRTRRAVRDAVQAGCIVTLATGRRFASARPVAERLGLELPIILHNGALIKDSVTGEILYHEPLPVGAAELGVEACVELGVQPILYENGHIGDGLLAGPSEFDGPFAGPYLLRAGSLLRRLPYYQLAPPDPPIQMAAYDRADRIDLVQRGVFRYDLRAVVSITSTGGSFLELLSAACTKATGIRHLAQLFGITMDDVMAIGDNFNDVEMLSEVGFGVAMGNAPEQVQKHAKALTGANTDDGVAQAIERYILQAREP